MSRLGSYTGMVIVNAFQKAGWSISRQKGSHVAMEKPGQEATLSIPVLSLLFLFEDVDFIPVFVIILL